MTNRKEEILKRLEKRLKTSNPKKWRELSSEERSLVVNTYFEIRNTDYKNISYLLRQHAEDRHQIFILFAGVLIGAIAGPISTIIYNYLSDKLNNDFIIFSILSLVLILFIYVINRASSESLDEENVIERLLEIAKQTSIQD